MKRFLLVLVAVLLFGAVANADQYRNAFTYYGKVIDAQTLEAARSLTVKLDNPQLTGTYGLLTLWVCVTDANNSVTSVVMACTGSRDGGTTDYTLQSCDTVAGVCTSSNASWSKNPSSMTSPKCWHWRIDVEGLPEVECTLTPTGGAAADLLTVYATLSIKG